MNVSVNIFSRHLLRFLLQSPNGYHVGLCSQTPFTFGDEDQVMICLQKVKFDVANERWNCEIQPSHCAWYFCISGELSFHRTCHECRTEYWQCCDVLWWAEYKQQAHSLGPGSERQASGYTGKTLSGMKPRACVRRGWLLFHESWQAKIRLPWPLGTRVVWKLRSDCLHGKCVSFHAMVTRENKRQTYLTNSLLGVYDMLTGNIEHPSGRGVHAGHALCVESIRFHLSSLS